jgi:dienelactone hydrolase
MSDPELSTKAPESDAMEDQNQDHPSLISQHDSLAQTGPSMGGILSEHCTTDRPTTNTDRQPSGSMTKFGDVDVYISKPADYPNSPAKLLLLLTAGTGVHSTNNQIQADLFAAEGYVVIMPDQFKGDAAPNSKAMAFSAEEAQGSSSISGPSILEQVKLRAVETAKSFMVDMWLARQTPEKVLPILTKVLETARDEYADAVAHGEGIYAVGYCFGGKYVVMLAGEHDNNGDGGGTATIQIKAGAVAHATLVTREDLAAVRAPLTLVCVGMFTLCILLHDTNQEQKMIRCSHRRSWKKAERTLQRAMSSMRSRRFRACLMVSTFGESAGRDQCANSLL